ncbi:MAG: hypothetical protein ACYSUG_08070, partial [Planctomycetota bacterium]
MSRLNNCIVWGNTAANDPQLAGYYLQVSYCNVQEGFSGRGHNNINTDPLFCDPNHFDYHLLPGSPCKNTGDPSGNYNGLIDIDGDPRVMHGRVDMGADEHNSVPVADSGNDKIVYAFVDGYADVWLNGTGSYDVDGDMLEYYWYNDANDLIASGAEPNVVLPVGEHVIDLVVNDGVEDSEPDSCAVTVFETIEVEAELTPGVLNRDSGRPHVIGRLAFAGEAMPVLDPNEPMVLLAGQGQIEDQRQILDYSKKEDAWYLKGFF